MLLDVTGYAISDANLPLKGQAMTGTVYAATRTFDKLEGNHVVSVDANGGSVAIQVEHGSENWIVVETITSDSAKVMNFGNRRVYQFVVTGSATFAI